MRNGTLEFDVDCGPEHLRDSFPLIQDMAEASISVGIARQERKGTPPLPGDESSRGMRSDPSWEQLHYLECKFHCGLYVILTTFVSLIAPPYDFSWNT